MPVLKRDPEEYVPGITERVDERFPDLDPEVRQRIAYLVVEEVSGERMILLLNEMFNYMAPQIESDKTRDDLKELVLGLMKTHYGLNEEE